MIVFSNRRLGPAAELLVSAQVAGETLEATAEAASTTADDRWERELVGWLRDRASQPVDVDVEDIAWSPEHFEHQRRFLLDAIAVAVSRCRHGRALQRWAAMIEAHPRDSVQVGRRWALQPNV